MTDSPSPSSLTTLSSPEITEASQDDPDALDRITLWLYASDVKEMKARYGRGWSTCYRLLGRRHLTILKQREGQ